MTHPHRDLIIKLLDDPTLEVEWFDEYDGEWWLCVGPLANMVNYPSIEHRLREKPKPDVVAVCRIGPYKAIIWNSKTDTVDRANLRLTFTADGALKNAEVL